MLMKSQHNLKPHYIMHSQYVMLNIRWWLYYFISIKYIFHYLFLNILTISSLSKMNYINTTYLGTYLPTYILIFMIYIPGFSYINNIYRLIKRTSTEMSTLESSAVLISCVFLRFMSYCFSGINWQVPVRKSLAYLPTLAHQLFARTYEAQTTSSNYLPLDSSRYVP